MTATEVQPGTRGLYSEVRWWARFLRVFTPTDLAGAMAVHREVAERGIKALLWHGICENGEVWEGPDGPEPVLRYKPLPPGPKEHETGTPPEVIAVRELYGGLLLYNERGRPVRIAHKEGPRGPLSQPGVRLKILQRERRFYEQEDARRKRAERDRLRGQKEPKWKRKGGARHVVDRQGRVSE